MSINDAFTRLNEAVLGLAIAMRTDDLTGLGNMVALREDIEAALGAIDELSHLVFGDLNGFKAINDQYSHDAGDAVIEHAGQVLRNLCRKWSVKGYRKSGDEFMLIIPDRRLTDVFKDLENQFRECRLPVQDHTLEFSASFGICRMADADLETIQRRAEEACQVAKQSGSNTVVVQWTEALSVERVEQRFRCPECGSSTKCTMAKARVGSPLVCPVCTHHATLDAERSTTAN